MARPRLLRVTTVPISLHLLLNGQLSFIQTQGFEILAVSADGPEIDQLRQQGIRHVSIPFTRKISPLQDLVTIYHLIKVIRSFRPNIVHTHTPKAGLLGMVAAWLCWVPVRLHTVAGIPYQETFGLKRQLLRWAEQLTYFTANQVYPNSKGLAQFMESEFFKLKKKFKVLGNGSSNGVNTEFFKPTIEIVEEASKLRKKYSIADQDQVVCFVGRLVRDKGLVELVQTFLRLSSQKPGLWLFLVGPLEQDLNPLPDSVLLQINESNVIICPGFQEDVRPWILASQMLVLPSYREGFPNVLLQASALERPCIATDINGCNEIIDSGSTGLLVKPKDVTSLETGLQKLLEHPAAAAEMGRQARKKIVNKFSQSYIWNELLKEYRQLVPLNDQTFP